MTLTKKQTESLNRFPWLPRDARFPEDVPIIIRNGQDKYAIWPNTYAAIVQKMTDTPFLPTDVAYDMLTVRCFARQRANEILSRVVSQTRKTIADGKDTGITDLGKAVNVAVTKGMSVRKGRYPKTESTIRIRDRTYNPGYVSEFMKITGCDTFFFAMDKEKRHILLIPMRDVTATPQGFMQSKEFQDLPVLFLLETLCSKQDGNGVADADIITQ